MEPEQVKAWLENVMAKSERRMRNKPKRPDKYDRLMTELDRIRLDARYETIWEMVLDPGVESLWLDEVYRVYSDDYPKATLDEIMGYFRAQILGTLVNGGFDERTIITRRDV